MRSHLDTPARRKFLRTLGAGALGLALSRTGWSAAKPLRGVFPIGQTPFTEDDNSISICCKPK